MSRILVVEDEILISEDLKQKLQSLGHIVVGEALSGNSAIEQVRELRPEVILLDVRLRGQIDGLEVARRIRETQTTPIVFITAHANGLAKMAAEWNQPLFVIGKPFTLAQLASVIAEAANSVMK